MKYKKKSDPIVRDNDFHKVAELELLTAVIANWENFNCAAAILTKSDFFYEESKQVWQIITELHNSKGQYDCAEVFAAIDNKNYVDILKNNIRTMVTIGQDLVIADANLVKSHSQLRRIRSIGERLMMNSSIEGIGSEIQTVTEELKSIIGETSREKDLEDMVADYHMSKYEEKSKNILMSGYALIDKYISLSRNNLWVIAARPSVGKTAFALCLLLKYSSYYKNRKKVLFFSLEMKEEEIFDRLCAGIGQIPVGALKSNDILNRFDDQLLKATSFLGSCKENIILRCMAAQSVSGIIRECHAYKPDIVIIDYLQLLTPSKQYEKRLEQVSDDTRMLKCLAMDMKCAVIALSQLNRNVESRRTNRPMMSDLRESGTIEQDADIITFLYKEKQDDPNSRIIAETQKNRSGEICSIYYDYNRTYQTFKEVDP